MYIKSCVQAQGDSLDTPTMFEWPAELFQASSLAESFELYMWEDMHPEQLKNRLSMVLQVLQPCASIQVYKLEKVNGGTLWLHWGR